MCDHCKEILQDFGLPHKPEVCPLLRASYCSLCCCYGHTTTCCPDTIGASLRKPHYVEQLLPASLLESYGIQTRTPLPKEDVEIQCEYKPVLEVYESDKVIRATLMNYGKPYSGKMKENRLRLQKLADELGRELLYRKPVSDLE